MSEKKGLWEAVARHMKNTTYGATPVNIIGEGCDANDVREVEPTKETKKSKDDEWVWVEGFKGMEKDMTCMGMQYEIGGKYVHPGKVEECASGYHFCLKLEDVFKYYSVGGGHRYFRVKGLVRKVDAERYGKVKPKKDNPNSAWSFLSTNNYYYDKVVAKEIVVMYELGNKEIFAALPPISDPFVKHIDEELFEIARNESLNAAIKECKRRELVKCGYSKPFIEMLVRTTNEHLVNRAIAVGNEPELSMDMKCWIIFKD